MKALHGALPVVLLFTGCLTVRAGELLPPDKPIAEVVDHYLDATLKENGVAPAPPADDATLIRRLTLDLVGRIPTTTETQTYLASTASKKRVARVDRLMDSSGFVRHQATEFNALLMAENEGSIRDYLLTAFQEKRSWDRMFRDLLLPDERDPKQRGAAEFVKKRLRDLDKLTGDVSILFFGVNVSCAKCHDHPLVADWKQDHFYGMKSFFSRTFDNGGFLAEREYGLVKFQTTKGQERQARLMFLTGKTIDAVMREPTGAEQKAEKSRLADYRKRKQPPPPPKFSARKQLVELALQPGQRDFFARAIVNRVWHRFFGYGLVMPVDQMHSENPPNHPELLEWLARDLVEHGYDLRRLIRGLVLSRAYARGSCWEGTGTPRPHLFAVARVRPLTPMQMAVSLRLATTDPQQFPATLSAAEFEKRMERLENEASGLATRFEQPHDDFQISAAEALLFSNNEALQKELLTEGSDRLLGRLKQIKDTPKLIDVAVRTVLCRPARADECQTLSAYLRQRADRHAAACRQLVWALLASAEFRFNY